MTSSEKGPVSQGASGEYRPDWKRERVPEYREMDEFKEAISKMKEWAENNRTVADLHDVDPQDLTETELEFWNNFAGICNRSNMENMSRLISDLSQREKEVRRIEDKKIQNSRGHFIGFLRNKIMGSKVYQEAQRKEVERLKEEDNRGK